MCAAAMQMFSEVKVPVLGVVENMSYYVCGKCHHRHDLFHGGGARLANQRPVRARAKAGRR